MSFGCGADVVRTSGVAVRAPHGKQINVIIYEKRSISTQESFNSYITFLLSTSTEELAAPKRHLALHLFKRVAWFGNPRFYSTWRDESLNKLLKQACQQMSQATFETCVLAHMSQLLLPKSERIARQRRS